MLSRLVVASAVAVLVALAACPSDAVSWPKLDDPRPAFARQFMAWAEQVGIRMDGMVVRAWGSNVDDGYEVIATRDLPVGHHVFEVPRDVAVRLDSTHSDFKERIRDHPNFWDNCAFREGSRPFVELTVMALYEAFYVQNSFWKPFWDIMPPNYDHMPSNGAYTQLEMDLIASSESLTAEVSGITSGVAAFVRWMHTTIVPLNPTVFGPATEENLATIAARSKWIYNVVITRFYNRRRQGDLPALVPVSDLLNHAQVSNPLTYAEQPGNQPLVDPSIPLLAYVQVQQTPVAAAQPIYASYQPYGCDSHWVAHYGFADVTGPADCFKFSVGLTPNSEHYEALNAMLRERNVLGNDGKVKVLIKEADPTSVLAALPVMRLGFMNQHYTPERAVQALSGPVSAANERSAVASLLRSLQSLEAPQKAHVEQTIASLEAKYGITFPRDANGQAVGRTRNERNILHVLYGEWRAISEGGKQVQSHWDSFLFSDLEDPHCC